MAADELRLVLWEQINKVEVAIYLNTTEKRGA